MTAGFKDYLREAFSAKPLGMFVPPNWVGIGAFALLGFVNPGFWLVGGGLELAYLHLLASNPRFRRWVDARLSGNAQRDRDTRVSERVKQLSAADAQKFHALEERCQAVLAHQQTTGALPDLQLQAEGLGRLLWIYLGLLQARQTLRGIMEGAGESTTEKLRRLEAQLRTEKDENVRKSLSGQLDILQQRTATQKEGRAKIDFLEAELDRIEQQVELIREQSLLAGDPSAVSRRIDEVGATLGGTTQWIRDQQKIYGQVQDLIDDAPPLPLQQTQ